MSTSQLVSFTSLGRYVASYSDYEKLKWCLMLYIEADLKICYGFVILQLITVIIRPKLMLRRNTFLAGNVDLHGDCSRQAKDDVSPQAAKKQKLENGLLNYLPATKGSSTSTSAPNSLKSLVNGDVKTAVTSMQAVSRSTPATPAGSVQAVA